MDAFNTPKGQAKRASVLLAVQLPLKPAAGTVSTAAPRRALLEGKLLLPASLRVLSNWGVARDGSSQGWGHRSAAACAEPVPAAINFPSGNSDSRGGVSAGPSAGCVPWAGPSAGSGLGALLPRGCSRVFARWLWSLRRAVGVQRMRNAREQRVVRDAGLGPSGTGRGRRWARRTPSEGPGAPPARWLPRWWWWWGGKLRPARCGRPRSVGGGAGQGSVWEFPESSGVQTEA